MAYTIDLQKIADELEFDLEDVEMLIEVFLEGAKESLETLKKAVETDNLEDIYKAAHSIKGSAANLMLDDISDLAKEMELNAREEKSLDYMSQYTKLDQLIDQLEEK